MKREKFANIMVSVHGNSLEYLDTQYPNWRRAAVT